MSLKKRKKIKSKKKEFCPEEISDEERLKELGIYSKNKKNEQDESWRDFG